MNKLTRLRAHLIAAPLGLDESDLLIYTEDGVVTTYPSRENENFRLGYQVHIIVTDYTLPMDQLFFFLAQWMASNETGHRPDAIRFEADIIDHRSADISISVDLTETVTVERTADGILLTHEDDPDMNPILLPAPEWEMFGNEEPLVDWIHQG